MAAAAGVWGNAPPWATGLPGRLHDFVKTVLLRQLVSPGATVCDLLCGRGTDTAKWAQAGIGSYVGLDLSASALQDAEEEWRTHGKPYPATFRQLDPFLGELESKLQDKDLPFDIVCCLGHLQDSFSTEDKVKQLLENVSSLLKSGGFFFGITADSSTLWSKYQKAVEGALKAGALRYGTIPRVKAELYSISFDDDRFSLFGTRYQLRFVDDGLAPQSQLLVHFPGLIRLAKEAGLEFIEIQNLDEFFEDYRNCFSDAFTSNCSNFLDPKGKLIPQIRDVLSLYTSFIFRKADSYSPGRATLQVSYELKDSMTVTASKTSDPNRGSERKSMAVESQGLARKSHKHLEDEAKPGKRAIFRKEKDAGRHKEREDHIEPVANNAQEFGMGKPRNQSELTGDSDAELAKQVSSSRVGIEFEQESNELQARDCGQDASFHDVSLDKAPESVEADKSASTSTHTQRSRRGQRDGSLDHGDLSRKRHDHTRGHSHERDDLSSRSDYPRGQRDGSPEHDDLSRRRPDHTRSHSYGSQEHDDLSRKHSDHTRSQRDRSQEHDGASRKRAEHAPVPREDERPTEVAERTSNEVAERPPAQKPSTEAAQRPPTEAAEISPGEGERPSGERAKDSEESTGPQIIEYKRRNQAWNGSKQNPGRGRWNSKRYQHYSGRSPTAEEIRAEMEAAQKRLNVPSILGPGPSPLRIHAYRRTDGSRNYSKERSFHRSSFSNGRPNGRGAV